MLELSTSYLQIPGFVIAFQADSDRLRDQRPLFSWEPLDANVSDVSLGAVQDELAAYPRALEQATK